MIGGLRVEAIEDPTKQRTRYFRKLAHEPAKGKSMPHIPRDWGSGLKLQSLTISP
ncbi:MAG: DUF2200 family protein [Opitutaceae bacterium]|nr:DUF2200 family protein [Opitutaceae bacterium]